MIKNWILNLKFVQDALSQVREAERKTAFKFAHQDIQETMKQDIEEKAEKLAVKKLNDLLSPADLTCIVTLDKARGMISIGGEKVEDGRLANLCAEAEFISRSDLWKLMYESPKELAQRAMFVSGDSLADMQKGKSILYALSTQKNIMDTFKSYVKK